MTPSPTITAEQAREAAVRLRDAANMLDEHEIGDAIIELRDATTTLGFTLVKE